MVLVPWAVALWGLCGQAAQVFHAETRLVVVHATVRDGRGGVITNLDEEAFRVYENGKRQPLSLFLGENTAVSIGIVIDNSGSMRTRRPEVEAAAIAFARTLDPQDEMFVVNFADTPHIDVPMTRDRSALEAGIRRIDTIGGTAIWDAGELATRHLNDHAGHDRKALLLITDGLDNASSASDGLLRRLAEHNNIAIYAIGLPHRDPEKALRARRTIRKLVEGTGGGAVHAETMTEVHAAALHLARQIRYQYTLAYPPVNQTLDGSYRRIRVTVAGRGGLSVRTRSGYFATRREPK